MACILRELNNKKCFQLPVELNSILVVSKFSYHLSPELDLFVVFIVLPRARHFWTKYFLPILGILTK